MTEATNKQPIDGDEQKRARTGKITPEDLQAVVEASARMQENRQHTIRTRELDAELEQCKTIINQFLSRHAHEAVAAMEFMFAVVPTQLAQIAQILSAHRFTYIPLVDTLNHIAYSRRAAAEEAAKGGGNG